MYLIEEHPTKVLLINIKEGIAEHRLAHDLLGLDNILLTRRLLGLLLASIVRNDSVAIVVFELLNESFCILLAVQTFHLSADVDNVVFDIFEQTGLSNNQLANAVCL
jgi:hypothetical protein